MVMYYIFQTVILILRQIICNMQPRQHTAVILVILNRVYGCIFVSDRFLRLTCFESECTISKTEHALQCKINGTCLAIFWKQNDTCYFCRCPMDPLQVIPVNIHVGSTLYLRRPFDIFLGKHSLIYLLKFDMHVFLSIINVIWSLECITSIHVDPNQEHYDITRLMSMLLMPWHLESPWYQRWRDRLYMINKAPSSPIKKFNCTHQPSLEE